MITNKTKSVTRRCVDRLLASSDACLRRTEESAGCTIDEFPMTDWQIRRHADRRQIDRRNRVRENSDRRAR